MPAVQETVERVKRIDVDQYRYGFETLIETDKAPKGLSEDTVRFISAKKNEPAWMLEWRLEAYRRWLTMTEPTWARVNYPKIDYQDLYYYSAPKPKKQIGSLDEIDPEILKTYEKLGIPLREVEVLEGVVRPEGERRIAVDAVYICMFIFKGLNFTAFNYAVYLVLAVSGYVAWRLMEGQ